MSNLHASHKLRRNISNVLYAARALNTLATTVTYWSEDQSKREALVQLGRSVLIKWLLTRALVEEDSPEQAEAEHTLLNLLADGQSPLISFDDNASMMLVTVVVSTDLL